MQVRRSTAAGEVTGDSQPQPPHTGRPPEDCSPSCELPTQQTFPADAADIVQQRKPTPGVSWNSPPQTIQKGCRHQEVWGSPLNSHGDGNRRKTSTLTAG